MGWLLGWLPMQLLLVFVMHSSWATDGWPVDAFPIPICLIAIKTDVLAALHIVDVSSLWNFIIFHILLYKARCGTGLRK